MFPTPPFAMNYTDGTAPSQVNAPPSPSHQPGAAPLYQMGPGMSLQPVPPGFTTAFVGWAPPPMPPYTFLPSGNTIYPMGGNEGNSNSNSRHPSTGQPDVGGSSSGSGGGVMAPPNVISPVPHESGGGDKDNSVTALRSRNAQLERQVSELKEQVMRLLQQQATERARWEAYRRDQQSRLATMATLLEQERQAVQRVFPVAASEPLLWRTEAPVAVASPPSQAITTCVFKDSGEERSEGSSPSRSLSVSQSAHTAADDGAPHPGVLDTLYGPARALLSMPMTTSAEFLDFYVALRRVEQRTGFLTAAVRAALLGRCQLEDVEPPSDAYWGLLQHDTAQWRRERYYFVHKCLRFLPQLRRIAITQCKYFPLRVDKEKGLEENWFPRVEEAAVLGTWWKAEEVEAFCTAFEARSPGQLKVIRLSKSYGPKEGDLEALNAACGGKLEFV